MLCDEIEFKDLGNPHLYMAVTDKERFTAVLRTLCEHGSGERSFLALKAADSLTLTSCISSILGDPELLIPNSMLSSLNAFLVGEKLAEKDKLSDSATVPICHVLITSLSPVQRDSLFCIFRHFRRYVRRGGGG